MPLTPRQERFVDEYLIDLNATQAALRAGYSPNGVRQAAAILLSNHDVRAAVRQRKAARAARTAIKADRILQELARIAFFDVTGAVTVQDGRVIISDTKTLSTDQRAALAEVAESKNGLRIKAHDKLKALELLGRHLAMFTDVVKVPDEPPKLEITIVSPGSAAPLVAGKPAGEKAHGPDHVSPAAASSPG